MSSKVSRKKASRKKARRKKKVQAQWTEAEHQAWQLPEDLTVSEWADKNRVLDPRTSAEPGPWRTDRTPYLREIMDAFSDPSIEEITFMKSTQIGGTEFLLNVLGYIVDQDPAPTILVYPREDDCRSMSRNRISPMLGGSATLEKHTKAGRKGGTMLEFQLDRMPLYLAGSNSPAGLAARAVRNAILDECDKFPPFSGKEADPIKLTRERTRTFWNRKLLKVSTPTTSDGYISQEYASSDRRKYYIPCPKCGFMQIMYFRQIKWPEDERDPDTIRTMNMAWYECIECNEIWTDREKIRCLKQGMWIPDEARLTKKGELKDVPQTRHRGYWINCLYSPWLTFSEIAAEFLESRSVFRKYLNFVNSWLGEPWEEKTQESKPERLAARALDYPEGSVPIDVKVLTAGVDVQQDHFWAIIRGWGFHEESWLIRAMRLETWEEVITVLFKTAYPRFNQKGDPYQVRLACIDSGFRTDEVYQVCRKWSHVCRAVKGDYRGKGQPYRASNVSRPGSGIDQWAGLRFYNVDVSYYKDKITRMANSEPGDPAQWHLFHNPSETYLNQFCAEHKVLDRNKRTGRALEVWKPVPGSPQNHFLDCEVYAATAADMLHVSMLRPEAESVTYNPATDKRRGNFLGTRGERGFVTGRKGWLSGR